MIAILPDRNWRVVTATLIVVIALIVAGCGGNRGYTTSVSEPSTGAVIDDVSVETVTPVDGARLQLNYSVDSTDDRSYSLGVYELRNGSYEPQTSYRLTPDERTTKLEVSVPHGNESVVEQQIRVERGENRTVVDAVTVTVRTDES